MHLEESEKKKLDEWLEKHLAEAHGGKQPYVGAIGGNFYYKLTMTGLGTITSVNCYVCEQKVIGPEASKRRHEEHDKFGCVLTDFSDW